jgi:iron(III)-enterobactin esterase
MQVLEQLELIDSVNLGREVQCTWFFPPGFSPESSYPLLVLNDGQDMEQVGMKHILDYLWSKNICAPFVAVAPHTTRRLEEYGVMGIPDFKNRGALAYKYAQFLVTELLPQSEEVLNTRWSVHLIAGFSLGALSAFDIAWNYPHVFSKVGAFSPSFWWRKKDLAKGYTDSDRIMHEVVRNTGQKPGLSIWFQCGTMDETSDRNNNGVIDSIDDTLDLMEELLCLGFVKNEDVFYTETIAGRHTQETYGIMFPFFLHWALPKRS